MANAGVGRAFRRARPRLDKGGGRAAQAAAYLEKRRPVQAMPAAVVCFHDGWRHGVAWMRRELSK
jgi:hypothetical protein